MVFGSVKEVMDIRGSEPRMLVETIIRNRIYESVYWKESCFGLSAVTIIDRAIELQDIGGQYGNQKPTQFLCLVLKLLEIQPSKEIIIEYIGNEDYKYLSALGAFYLRLTGSSLDVYQHLEPLLSDYRKLRKRNNNGSQELFHMDTFVDLLLREERVCDIILPRIHSRYLLEENDELPPKVSKLDLELESNASSNDNDDESNSINSDSDSNSNSSNDDEIERKKMRSKFISYSSDENSDNNRRSRSRSPISKAKRYQFKSRSRSPPSRSKYQYKSKYSSRSRSISKSISRSISKSRSRSPHKSEYRSRSLHRSSYRSRSRSPHKSEYRSSYRSRHRSTSRSPSRDRR